MTQTFIDLDINEDTIRLASQKYARFLQPTRSLRCRPIEPSLHNIVLMTNILKRLSSEGGVGSRPSYASESMGRRKVIETSAEQQVGEKHANLNKDMHYTVHDKGPCNEEKGLHEAGTNAIISNHPDEESPVMAIAPSTSNTERPIGREVMSEENEAVMDAEEDKSTEYMDDGCVGSLASPVSERNETRPKVRKFFHLSQRHRTEPSKAARPRSCNVVCDPAASTTTCASNTSNSNSSPGSISERIRNGRRRLKAGLAELENWF